jgi:hypothetical protein
MVAFLLGIPSALDDEDDIFASYGCLLTPSSLSGIGLFFVNAFAGKGHGKYAGSD